MARVVLTNPAMAGELRQAIRTLARNPGFAASAVLLLALGCGATTAIFSVAYGVMLRDLPYDQPDRLVSIGEVLPAVPEALAGAADYFDWRERQQVFEDLALTRAISNFNLTGSGEPERLLGTRATASLFSTLRVTPLLGRTFTEAEQLDPQLASHVAVLSYGLWQRRFAADPAIVGQSIELNGAPVEVIGVMRPEFRYPSREFQLWMPLYIPPQALSQRFDNSYLAVARLRDGVTLEQASANLSAIAANLAREYPRSNTDVGVRVEPMLGELTGAVRPALWVLLAAVGTLFLIACANLAGLLLARATGRGKEFAIRAALGATRARLARQFLVEALPVAAAGCLLGVLMAAWILAAVIPLLPASMPRIDEIGLHAPVLALTALLSIAAAILISIAPAMQISANVERGPASHGRLRDGLMVAEIAATVVLLIGAGLLLRSFVNLRATDPGFSADNVLSLQFAVNRSAYGDGPSDAESDAGVARYLGRLINAVGDVPGVDSVGIVNRLPLGGVPQINLVRFEGMPDAISIDSRPVNGAYFETLKIPLLAGRTFTDRDTPDAPQVGIIDERLAREVFGSQNPIGKRFRIGLELADVEFPWVEIVGVAGHVRQEELAADPRPQVYWPYQQWTQDRAAMVVRTEGDPGGMIPAVQAAIHSLDPGQPLYDVQPMARVVSRSLLADRLNLVLVGAFAALALLLAAVGLYGVVSHLTARRAREFGIRLALGARQGAVTRMVLSQGIVRAAAGLVLGIAVSAAVTPVLGGMLHGVGPLDVVTYSIVAAVLATVILAASYVPARRAARIDPVEALRYE